ncbi:TPA: hypothetical protein TUW56_001637 [Streptococcus equi subsp. zooepidemicus]|nr:hypothetical protein [Streptococcus equi subsp. zooepidemicus]
MTKKVASLVLIGLDSLILAGFYWIYLPPMNVMSLEFWFFVILALILAMVSLFILSLFGLKKTVTSFFTQKSGRKDVTSGLSLKQLTGGIKWLGLALAVIIAGLSLLLAVNTRMFRAKSYAHVIKVKDADFNKDFPDTDLSALALLDRDSAEKIGDTYLGTIDKVSQFGISDEYRQITIGKLPYRVSPLEYKSFWKWLTNRKDGIGYYVKVNQTTGKAELVKLKQPMKYSHSEFMFRDTMRHLRFQYPMTIFSDPSFEVDDDGNPYYVATTYTPKFGLSSQDPTGVILLDAVSGKSQYYELKDVPKWVDRVYSADNVLERVNDYYTYQKGYWNTVFSQTDVKQTTDSYNYITIGSDIYLYTGITSATADSSNLGFILVNMRTREVTNYKLPSATEASAMKSAEGEVQEKKYTATAPTLVKLNDKAYYLISLKDGAGLIKSYALVDAEDYQQVTVNNDIQILISQFTDKDTSSLSVSDTSDQKVKMITGQVEQLASQIISGTTVYYISSKGQIYKIKASSETSDRLPFLKVGDQFKAQLADDNYLNHMTIESSSADQVVTE